MNLLKYLSFRTDHVFLSRQRIILRNVGWATIAGDAVPFEQALVFDQGGLVFSATGKTFSGANTYSGTNTFSNSTTFSSAIVSSATTQSTSATTGAIITAGGLGVAKNLYAGGLLVAIKGFVRTPTLTAINTTGAATLAVMSQGLIAGGFSSTSAAGVTATLDSVANIITAFAAAGVTIAAGHDIEFVIDNTQGANTVTLAVDSGATIAVATPAITGGATLTVSTANKYARFNLHIASATTGILSRLI